MNEDSVTWTQLLVIGGVSIAYLLLTKLAKRVAALEKTTQPAAEGAS